MSNPSPPLRPPEPARDHPGTRLLCPCTRCGRTVELRGRPPAVGAFGVCPGCTVRLALVGGRVTVDDVPPGRDDVPSERTGVGARAPG